jgi:hypothetical protein
MVENLPPDVLPQEWGGLFCPVFPAAKPVGFSTDRPAQCPGAVEYYNAYPTDTDDDRKQGIMDWYRFWSASQPGPAAKYTTRGKTTAAGLLCHTSTQEDNHIPFTQLINRMSSLDGEQPREKQFVIVTRIELLHGQIGRGLIPANDIWCWRTRRFCWISSKSMWQNTTPMSGCSFARVLNAGLRRGQEHSPPFLGQEMTVFYYRSDNLSDEQKEKIINFRNFDNDGQWYIPAG